MTKFRHLIWMIFSAAGLMLSVSQSFAQQPDVGDQPGLLADDSVELDPEYKRTAVLYRTTEAPGTAAFEASCTTPEMLPRPAPDCPSAGTAKIKIEKIKTPLPQRLRPLLGGDGARH